MAENVGTIYSDFIIKYESIPESITKILQALTAFNAKAEKAGEVFGAAFNKGLDSGLKGSNVVQRLGALVAPFEKIAQKIAEDKEAMKGLSAAAAQVVAPINGIANGLKAVDAAATTTKAKKALIDTGNEAKVAAANVAKLQKELEKTQAGMGIKVPEKYAGTSGLTYSQLALVQSKWSILAGKVGAPADIAKIQDDTIKNALTTYVSAYKQTKSQILRQAVVGAAGPALVQPLTGGLGESAYERKLAGKRAGTPEGVGASLTGLTDSELTRGIENEKRAQARLIELNAELKKTQAEKDKLDAAPKAAAKTKKTKAVVPADQGIATLVDDAKSGAGLVKQAITNLDPFWSFAQSMSNAANSVGKTFGNMVAKLTDGAIGLKQILKQVDAAAGLRITPKVSPLDKTDKDIQQDAANIKKTMGNLGADIGESLADLEKKTKKAKPLKPLVDEAKTGVYDPLLGKSIIPDLVNGILSWMGKLKTGISSMHPFSGVATNAKLVSDQVEAEVKQMRAEVESEIRKIQALSRAKIVGQTGTLTARTDSQIMASQAKLAAAEVKMKATGQTPAQLARSTTAYNAQLVKSNMDTMRLTAERDAKLDAYTRRQRATTRATVKDLRTGAGLTEQEMRANAAAKAAEQAAKQQEAAAKRPMQALQGFNSFMGNATAKVDQFGTRLIWSGRIMQNWSRDIWYNLVRPLQMYGTQMVQFFGDLEQRVVKAATQVPKAAKGAADAIMASVLDISTRIPIVANEIADIYYYILSTLPKLSDAARLAQAPGIAEEIGKLAVAGGAPILDTGKAVITVMNAMGLASDDAAVTMTNLRKVTDQMFATVRVGKFDLADFTAGLGRVVGYGKEAGASIEEIFATLAAGSLITTPGQAATWAENLFKSFTQGARRQAWRNLGIELTQTVRGAMDMEWAAAGLGKEDLQELELKQKKLVALQHKNYDELATINQKLNTLWGQQQQKNTDANQQAIDNTEIGLDKLAKDYDVLSDNIDEVATRIAELQAKSAQVIWQPKPGVETMMRSPIEMFKELKKKLDEMPDVEDRLKAIGELFPNIRGAQAAFTLLRTLDTGELVNQLEEIFSASGEVNQAFKDMTATLQMQGTLLMNTVMKNLADALKPYIGRQGILYDIAVKFTDFAKSIGQIDPKRIREIVGALLGIVGLAGAGVLLGGVATGLGFLVTILAGMLSGPGLVAIVAWFFLLRPALEGVLPAIDAAGGGIDGIAKAFAALGVALGLWKPQEAVDFLSKMGIEVKTTELTVGPLADKVRTLAKDLGGLKTNIDNITNGFQRFFTMIVENQGAIASLLAVLAGLRLVGAIGGAAEGIGKLFGAGAAASTAGGVAAGGALAASTAGAFATLAPSYTGAIAGGAGIGGALLAMLTAPLSMTVGLVVASVIAAGVVALIVNELVRGTPLEGAQNIIRDWKHRDETTNQAKQIENGIQTGISAMRKADMKKWDVITTLAGTDATYVEAQKQIDMETRASSAIYDLFAQKIKNLKEVFRNTGDIDSYYAGMMAVNDEWHKYMMTLTPAAKALKDATLQAQWMAQDLAAQSAVSLGVSKGESYLSTTLTALSAAIQKRAAEDFAKGIVEPGYKSGFDATKASTEVQGYKDKFAGLQDMYAKTGNLELYNSGLAAINESLITFAENMFAMAGSFDIAVGKSVSTKDALKSRGDAYKDFLATLNEDVSVDIAAIPKGLRDLWEANERAKDDEMKASLANAARRNALRKSLGLSAGDDTVGGEAGVGTGPTLLGMLGQAFPNAAAALAWRNAFKEQHGGADPTLTNLRDRQAGEAYALRTGKTEITDEEWKKRFYAGGFPGEKTAELDALFGAPGTWATLLKGQADAEQKLQGEWIAAFGTKMDAVAATIVNGINIKLGGSPEDHTGKRQIKMTDSPSTTKWWPVGQAPPDGWEEMAKGGYAKNTWARLGERGREFVMDAPTTALFERQVGMLSQSRLADMVRNPATVMLQPSGSTFNVSGATVNINGNVGTAQMPMIQAALTEANDALVRDMERKLQRNSQRRWA